jgi:dihydroorotase
MLLKNASIVGDNGELLKRDILIEHGKILEISENIDSLSLVKEKFLAEEQEVVKTFEVRDLCGKLVLPGIIDVHTHMRDPGLCHKEDLHTGSRACAKGGITTFLDMPNTIPPTVSAEELSRKRELAAEKSIVNYGFHFGATSDNMEEVKKAVNVASTKVFLNVSTGKMLIEDEASLAGIFENSRIVSVHAEDEMVQKAIDLNEKYGNTLYLCHISQKKEIEMVKEHRKNSEKKIYVEVTPHHLFLCDEDREKDETSKKLLIMKPELKTRNDMESLWEAINEGVVDTIGTDHAPHLVEEKLSKTTFGIPGVENSLQLMLTAVNSGKLSLKKLIQLMCENPAKIFGLKNKGFIKEGYDADLVVVDMEKELVIKNSDVVSKCGWTPFDGKPVKGTPVATIVNGKFIYDNGIFHTFNGREVEIYG